jgi:hypothetical protein
MLGSPSLDIHRVKPAADIGFRTVRAATQIGARDRPAILNFAGAAALIRRSARMDE